MSGLRRIFILILTSIVIGLAIGLLRYDDGCLEFSHRFLVASLNAFIVFSGAVAFEHPATRLSSGNTVGFFLLLALSGILTAAAATALSIAIVQPLVAPEPLRISDYVYVFFVPSLLVFPAVAYVVRLRTRNHEFAAVLRSYQERTSQTAPVSMAARSTAEPASEAPEETDAIFQLKTSAGVLEISMDEIIYVSGSRKKSVVHTYQRDYESNVLIKEVLERLPARFLRVHKSYLVNLRLVDQVKYQIGGSYLMTLRDEDDTTLPVGRRYLKDLRRALSSAGNRA